MKESTKILLIISGVLALGGLGAFVYKEYIHEPKGEGEVTPNAKSNRNIIFTRI